MFVSTVVPSIMLSAKRNMNKGNYNFSIPYNFIRGRDIIVNIHPLRGNANATTTWNTLVNSSGDLTAENRINIVIPNDVTVYTTSLPVKMTLVNGNGGNVYTPDYVVEIKCDTVNNIITFTPTSVIGSDGGNRTDALDTRNSLPVLIVVATVM